MSVSINGSVIVELIRSFIKEIIQLNKEILQILLQDGRKSYKTMASKQNLLYLCISEALGRAVARQTPSNNNFPNSDYITLIVVSPQKSSTGSSCEEY